MTQSSLTPAERRLVRIYRINITLGFLVGAGMLVIIVLLAFALVRASDAINETERVAVSNCVNIEVNRAYYASLTDILSQSIRDLRKKGQPVNPLLRDWLTASRLAQNSMLSTDCQEAQG